MIPLLFYTRVRYRKLPRNAGKKRKLDHPLEQGERMIDFVSDFLAEQAKRPQKVVSNEMAHDAAIQRIDSFNLKRRVLTVRLAGYMTLEHMGIKGGKFRNDIARLLEMEARAKPAQRFRINQVIRHYLNEKKISSRDFFHFFKKKAEKLEEEITF